MTDDLPQSPRELLSTRYLFHPSTLIIFVANLVPLYGVLAWHWDAFLLLMLYWMETVIIGVWTIAAIGILPPDAFPPIYSDNKPIYGRGPRIAFFVVHAGMFAAGHLLFLWTLFAGAWAQEVHGVASFFDKIVIASWLWVPLAALFAARGASFLFHDLYPDLLPGLLRLVSERPVRLAPRRDHAMLLLGFYGRLIVMQFVIILGAMLSVAFGTMAPFVLLILIKTMVDVLGHIAFDMGLVRPQLATSSSAA